MIKFSRIAALLLMDALFINITYIFALVLRFDFDVDSEFFSNYFQVYFDNLIIITAVLLITFWLFGLYNSLWKYAGMEEIAKVCGAVLVGTVIVMAYMLMTQQFLPRSTYVYACNMEIILIGLSRMGYRYFRNMRTPGTFNVFNKEVRGGVLDNLVGKGDITKVMLVGAGDAGASIIKELRQHPEYGKKVVVAIDDDEAKIGKRIIGVKVASRHQDIKKIARKYGIDEIIIAIPSATKKQIQNIITECNKTRCKMKILPSLMDLINGNVSVATLRDVDIEDLLGRDPVQVNLKEISGYLEGKIVMVTGGGGSIGAELCRQIGRFRPRRIIALDIYENTVFELQNEMKNLYPALEFNITIASVRDFKRMEEVFSKYKPHVVFHAAAHKHVPLMEDNPKEAIINNILGTKNLVDLSDKYAVDKFVLISTDKAVNPANVMGATKRVAEMLLQYKSAKSRTRYSAVRFGNVLGSNGSVIPIFRKQIEQGGPVTVTHPDITRYFMTIPEAVQLVIQAGALAEGGEIFILDMGDPVRIMDLAENVISLSGYIPYVDIDIQITGLRPGEKLYEELLLDEEGIKRTSHNKIYVGHPVPPSEALEQLLDQGEDGIREAIGEIIAKDDAAAKEWLNELIPNYSQRAGSKREVQDERSTHTEFRFFDDRDIN